MASYLHKYQALWMDGNGMAAYHQDLSVRLDGSSPYTVTAWVNINRLSKNAHILYKEGEFALSIVENSIELTMNGYAPVRTNPILLEEEWLYIAASYSGRGKVYLWLDGAEKISSSVNGSGSHTQNPCYFASGMDGFLRSVRIYDRMLPEEKICNYMYSMDLKAEGLSHYFNFTVDPPLDEITKNPISLSRGGVIAQLTPCAGFSKGTSAYPVESRSVNPGGNGYDSYTVQTWVYVLPFSDDSATIFENRNDREPCGMSLFLDKSDNGFRVRALHGSIDHAENLLSSETLLPYRTWVNLATTFDNRTLSLYINGKSDCRTSAFIPMEDYAKESFIRIGSDADPDGSAGDNWFSGSISRIDVWDSALCEEDLKKYMEQIPDGEEGLCASYLFLIPYPEDTVSLKPVSSVGVNLAKAVVKPSEGAFCEAPLDRPKRDKEAAPGHVRQKALAEWRDALPLIERAVLAAQAAPPETDNAAEWELFQHNLAESLKLFSSGDFLPLGITHENTPDGGLAYYLHFGGDSFYMDTLTREQLVGLDDYTIWLIDLVAIIIVGVVQLVISLPSPRIPEGLIQFIRNMFNTRVFNDLAPLLDGGTAGQDMENALDPKVIWKVLSFLYEHGLLWEAIRLTLVGGGFWLIMTAVGKLATWLFGAGWPVFIAKCGALLIAIAAHLSKKPQSAPDLMLESVGFDKVESYVYLTLKRGLSPIESPHYTYSTKEDSLPVAYHLAGLSEFSPALTVQLRSTATGKYWVRTTVTPLDAPMGTVAAKQVSMDKNRKDGTIMNLNLENIKAAAKGTGRYDFTWKWEYSKDGKNYREFGTTRHTLYLLLDAPANPWGQSEPVWCNVLDLACVWTSGITDTGKAGKRQAVSKIASALNNIDRLLYDVKAQKSHYTKSSTCKMDSFLRDYQTTQNVLTVNHKDMAALLVSFSNAVGCNIFGQTLGSNFKLKDLLPVGHAAPPQGLSSFSTYEVAAESIPEDGHYIITDACCKLKNTATGSNDYTLALGVPFDGDSPEAYRTRLTAEPEKCSLLPPSSKTAYGRRRNS